MLGMKQEDNDCPPLEDCHALMEPVNDSNNDSKNEPNNDFTSDSNNDSKNDSNNDSTNEPNDAHAICKHPAKSNSKKRCKPGQCCMGRPELKRSRDVIIPSRSPWAFFILQHKQPKEKAPDCVKRLGPQWKSLQDNERTKYVDMAVNDKIRFERELSKMNLDQREAYQRCKRNRQRRTRQEHPRMTNYNMFVKLELPKIKAEHPEFDFEAMGKELGRQWRELTPEQKQDYKSKSNEHKLNKLKQNKKRHKHCK